MVKQILKFKIIINHFKIKVRSDDHKLIFKNKLFFFSNHVKNLYFIYQNQHLIFIDGNYNFNLVYI